MLWTNSCQQTTRVLAPEWYSSANVVLVTDPVTCLYGACLAHGLLYEKVIILLVYMTRITHAHK